jgi:hypothetical protein
VTIAVTETANSKKGASRSPSKVELTFCRREKKI